MRTDFFLLGSTSSFHCLPFLRVNVPIALRLEFLISQSHYIFWLVGYQTLGLYLVCDPLVFHNAVYLWETDYRVPTILRTASTSCRCKKKLASVFSSSHTGSHWISVSLSALFFLNAGTCLCMAVWAC